MDRIGIYTGTFNPPHVGHFRGAQYACEALSLHKLLLIPDGIMPHKQPPQASPEPRQRLEMVRLGAPGDEKVEVSDLSVRNPEPCYTWKTVASIRQRYPEAELYYLLGSDMLSGFPQWQCPEKILAEATVVVLSRGDDVHQGVAAIEKMGGRVICLENPIVNISSTQLRRMLVFRCASEFIQKEEKEYIYRNGFYGTGKDYRNLSIEELEETVVSLLKPNRVAHVLGCRQAAVELARIYGVDETNAARAALLHDITKALDGPLQLTLCREYGTILDTFGTKNPKTLHALTGSLVAERIFGENEEVVAAIRCHTTGKADMNLLEKIIYVADYMEPNRDFPGVERLRELAYTDITQALKLGLEMTLDLLVQQGREISPESMDALNWLKR